MIFEMTGGAAKELNFKIKAYETEDAMMSDVPKQNTIGVVTTTPITSWVLSATEPANPEAGMVWITVGKNDKAEFNVLKKNILNVYPMLAEQYIDGAWVKVVARSYRNNEWQEWKPRVYVFNNGDDCFDVTGGWNFTEAGSYIDGNVLRNNGGDAYTTRKIDVTKYDKFVINCTEFWKTISDPDYHAGGACGLTDSQSSKNGFVAILEGRTGTLVADISNLTGEYYVTMFTYLAMFKVSEIYLE